MITKSEYANQQAPTGAGIKQSENGTPAHFPPLSASELAAFLRAGGILPGGQGRDWDDGGQKNSEVV